MLWCLSDTLKQEILPGSQNEIYYKFIEYVINEHYIYYHTGVRPISCQYNVTSFYQHIRLYTKNKVTMYSRELVARQYDFWIKIFEIKIDWNLKASTYMKKSYIWSSLLFNRLFKLQYKWISFEFINHFYFYNLI